MITERIGRVAALCAISACALTAAANPTRLLLGPALGQTVGEVVEIGPGGVVFLDDIGRTRTLAWSRVIALTTPPEPAGGAAMSVSVPPGASEPVAMVDTVDGQRLIGALRPAEAEGGGGALSIDLGSIGVATVNLDRIAQVVLGAGRVLERGPLDDLSSAADGGDDVVALINGDRVSGFVLGVGERVEIDAGSGVVEIPLERVSGFALANPSEPPGGPRVWLLDGMVLAVAPWSLSTGSLSIETRGLGEIAPDRVAAFAPDSGLIAGLASRPVASHTPAPSRRWTMPPEAGPVLSAALGAAEVRIPGPMAVDWSLEPRDARLSMIAGLVRGYGDRPGPWADCVVRVEVVARGGRVETLAEHRLTTDEPDASVNVELPGVGESGRLLRVVVDAGAYGPIQDAVVLEMPLLLRAE